MNQDKIRTILEGLERQTLKEFPGLKVPVQLVIFSHLSDIQEVSGSKDVNNRINFIKSLLLKFKSTKDVIDADKEWAEFTKSRFYKP